MLYDELVKRLRYAASYDERIVIQDCKEAADANDELTRENESLAKSVNEASEILRRRWIPVTERLPEDGSDILAVLSYCGEVRIIPANYDRGVWYDCIFNRVAEHITHWMPLPTAPEPPKEE